MPHFSRIASQAPFLQENGSGLVLRTQGAGTSDTDARPVPPGTERVEGAFEVFGLLISGLIILFAVVLLVMRAPRNR